MKKVNLLTVAALLSISLIGSTISFAEENEGGGDQPEASKKAESQIKVGIEPGDDKVPTDPIDPEDPENPGEGGTGQIGNLTIDMITNLDFGTFKLTSKETTVTPNKDKTKNPMTQVTDKRGTGAGWTLDVAMSEFKSKDKKTLKGAKLTIPKGELKTNNVDKAFAPENFEVSVNDEAQTIMTAAKDKGLGTWANSYSKEETKLTIPAGNFAGEYGSTLTWTLSNAPK
ncbi:hypothetical protein DOK67_0000597 [Enterococcus sp. DIV0212c]|uniref:WxL domain-containing protein n=1 Tax=Enterococcus sp. DIV0212c TaxID=2230867 RepID=UPI001A9B495E|nr:WxL domain-containing protein [Enterococcus sp. DIV0212c]MBO1354577.1 WxL domain-containing protein [Enterococcus sp. DIV0212c]